MGGRITRTGISACVIAVAAVIELTGMALAAEFSADLKLTGGRITVWGRVFVKGRLERRDTDRPPDRVIERPDKGVIWVLSLAHRTYFEVAVPGLSSGASYLAALRKKPNFKKAGRAMIAGYVCDKYTYDDTKSEKSCTVYFSPQLQHQLKLESWGRGMAVVSELRNVKLGKQANSLFTIPAGFKKTAIGGPGAPGGMATPKAPAAVPGSGR